LQVPHNKPILIYDLKFELQSPVFWQMEDVCRALVVCLTISITTLDITGLD